MTGGMVYRKDCEDCGRSFFTPDRKIKRCPRCLRDYQERKGQAKTAKGTTLGKPSSRPDVSAERRSQLTAKGETKGKISREEQGHQRQGMPREKKVPKGNLEASEFLLTKEQEDEIIRRYQGYVERMERPSQGRRKVIAAEMGIPEKAVVLTVRKWNEKNQMSGEVNQEKRFAVEKSYFSFLKTESSLQGIKERIAKEAGLDYWQVSRYLDVLHDGEDRLARVPDVSSEQRETLLAEYQAYLSASAPPGPSLHQILAEKTGVTRKQVHKVLLTYRLDRLKEKQG